VKGSDWWARAEGRKVLFLRRFVTYFVSSDLGIWRGGFVIRGDRAEPNSRNLCKVEKVSSMQCGVQCSAV